MSGLTQKPPPGSMSSRASISHRLRRTHSGQSASRRSLASGISCQPMGTRPRRRDAEIPQDEQNTRFRSPSGCCVTGTTPCLLAARLGDFDARHLYTQQRLGPLIGFFLLAALGLLEAPLRLLHVDLVEVLGIVREHDHVVTVDGS